MGGTDTGPTVVHVYCRRESIFNKDKKGKEETPHRFFEDPPGASLASCPSFPIVATLDTFPSSTSGTP